MLSSDGKVKLADYSLTKRFTKILLPPQAEPFVLTTS